MVGGSALVVCSAIFWAWSAIKQRLLRGPDEALDQPPEVGDDEKPRHGSGRRGSYRVPSSPALVKPEIDSPGFASTDRVGMIFFLRP